MGNKGDNFTTELGGIMKVTMLGFDLAYLLDPIILCWY